MSPRTLIAVLAVIACWPFAAGASDGLRCEEGLVDRGDGPERVRAACGEPDFVDRWDLSRIPPRRRIPRIETWVYNRGPQRLITILRFREGRLVEVKKDGYGFTAPGPRDCEPNRIAPGMSKYRLLEFCGEPDRKESVILHRAPRREPRRHDPFRHEPLRRGPGGTFVPVRRETWLYNFGSSRLVREVILENGVVADVVVGERGY